MLPIYYSRIKCLFCENNLIISKLNFSYCRCDYQYSIDDFAAIFHIGNYKFHITEKTTTVVDLNYSDIYECWRVDAYFEINKSNYLDIINKIKKLQIFD